MKVRLIPILNDNYAYLLEADDGTTGVVDPGEAGPVIKALEKRGLRLDVIFCTHHHGDHIAGVQELKSRYKAKVIGPEKDITRIPEIDDGFMDGDTFTFGEEKIEVIETPGHTKFHICYYAPGSNILFSGDTLFSMGCGRLFEGTPEQMFNSLQKLSALPDETQIFCGHEYTLSNAEFCLSIEPDNADLKARYNEVQELRAKDAPTLPVTLLTEKKTNSFLRAKDAEAFAKVRALKDNF